MDSDDGASMYMEHRPHGQNHYTCTTDFLASICLYRYTGYDPLLWYLTYPKNGITCFMTANIYRGLDSIYSHDQR